MTSLDQEPVNNCELARTVEPHAVASWPARESVLQDGWLLRFSSGHSGRANSVATHAYTGTDLQGSLARAEKAYEGRDRDCQFQITPATLPINLAERLRDRGYRAEPWSVLMVAGASVIERLETVSRTEIEVEIKQRGSSEFVRLLNEGSRSEADGNERLAVLDRVADPKACFVLKSDGVAVSSGACVSTGDWAGIYVMRTAVAHRRQGHGLRVLREAAHWALQHGTPQLYLQVDEANLAARALYARAGFRDGYRYRNYRIR
jgi:ribosomal protein S18 acetylase RimI-like enzyme